MSGSQIALAAMLASLTALGACQSVDPRAPRAVASVVNPDMSTSITTERAAINAACEASRDKYPAMGRCPYAYAARLSRTEWAVYAGGDDLDGLVSLGGVVVSQRDGRILRVIPGI